MFTLENDYFLKSYRSFKYKSFIKFMLCNILVHNKIYGILSVLLSVYYDIEYLFTVDEHVFNPPPKVKSAVIRLVRNQRTELGCDETLFKTVVKTGFNQRRKTLRNSLKPLIRAKADREGWSEDQLAEFIADPVFELRPERLSVEDFIALTLKLA